MSTYSSKYNSLSRIRYLGIKQPIKGLSTFCADNPGDPLCDDNVQRHLPTTRNGEIYKIPHHILTEQVINTYQSYFIALDLIGGNILHIVWKNKNFSKQLSVFNFSLISETLGELFVSVSWPSRDYSLSLCLLVPVLLGSGKSCPPQEGKLILKSQVILKILYIQISPLVFSIFPNFP